MASLTRDDLLFYYFHLRHFSHNKFVYYKDKESVNLTPQVAYANTRVFLLELALFNHLTKMAQRIRKEEIIRIEHGIDVNIVHITPA